MTVPYQSEPLKLTLCLSGADQVWFMQAGALIGSVVLLYVYCMLYLRNLIYVGLSKFSHAT